LTKKSEQTQVLLEKVPLRWPTPEPLAEKSLLEQGLYAVLRRRLEPRKALGAIEKLRSAYADWNELRVAQAQEIAEHLALGRDGVAVARDVREYLQEVFQRSHGLDLEFLRDDPTATARFVSQLPFIGMSTAHYLLHLASPDELPVTQALVRVLDRVGLIPRTASPKKARAAIEPLVAEGKRLEFLVGFGEVATRWCDARKPLCHLCVLVEDCRHGRKAFREWRVQQERMETQRVREAARQAVFQRKEDERRRREEERARKKGVADAARKAREDERKARADAKKREAAEKRAALERARADAARKREEERARKKAEAEAKKKAAAKKAAKASAKAASARKGGTKKKARPGTRSRKGGTKKAR
jgi:endonuclease III